MTSSHHKATAGLWITVALVAVLVSYPLSWGPACWITSRVSGLYPAFGDTYFPLVRAADRMPFLWRILHPYATFGMPEPGLLILPACDASDPHYIGKNLWLSIERP